jgi:P27 family predicted phage terminase small subunit
MSGPPKKPTALLSPDSWRRKERAHEPQPTGLPSAPRWLDKTTKAVYRQVASMLTAMGVGRMPDANVLCRYCRLWVRWKNADAQIQKFGEVQPMKDKTGKVICLALGAFTKLEKSLSADLLRIEQEFGMTPAARARIQVEIPQSKTESKAFLSKIVG